MSKTAQEMLKEIRLIMSGKKKKEVKSYICIFHASGTKINQSFQNLIKSLPETEVVLTVEKKPVNKPDCVDLTAMAILYNNVQIGWIPAEKAKILHNKVISDVIGKKLHPPEGIDTYGLNVKCKVSEKLS